MIAYMVYVNVTKHEKSRKNITDWLPLISDDVEAKEYLSKDEFIEAQKKLAAALKKKKNGATNPKNNNSSR